MKIVSFINNATDANDKVPRVGALIHDGTLILDFLRVAKNSNRAEGGYAESPRFDLDGPLLQQGALAYNEITSDQHAFSQALANQLLIERAAIRLLAPVPRPGKLIAIGLNYRDHASESNMPIPEKPVVFSKFTTSVIGPNEAVVLPSTSKQVDYEAELAVVIGRRAKDVARVRAFDYVLGYTIINDVSARDFQFADGQWQRGKSCDTFAPMGVYIATTDEVPDPHKLSIRLRLNGNTMQDSNTDQLIFGVPDLVSFLSETITLEPGDVIATGTPPGVGFARKPPVFLKDGDRMEIEIQGLGTLANPVIAAMEESKTAAEACSRQRINAL
jgi:2-keto-4-pentenoate hydratase/2-oxohepta-3-ene-1,7-dioic acid hydratase in catechol pathway